MKAAVFSVAHVRLRFSVVSRKLKHWGSFMNRSRRPSAHQTASDSRRRPRSDQVQLKSVTSPVKTEHLVQLRSLIGRLMSHPDAISIHGNDHGSIELTGPSKAEEISTLEKALLASADLKYIQVKLTPLIGMSPMDRAEPQETHFAYQSELIQPNWSPIARIVVGTLGALGFLLSKQLRPKLKRTVRLFGLASLIRALTNKNVTDAVGLIANPVIRLNDVGGLQWTAKGPSGALVRWNTYLNEVIENQTISWKSASHAWVRSAGRFHLSEAFDGRTRVQVELSYSPPAGALGYAAAHFLGFDPRMKIDEDLQVLKNLIEKQITHTVLLPCES